MHSEMDAIGLIYSASRCITGRFCSSPVEFVAFSDADDAIDCANIAFSASLIFGFDFASHSPRFRAYVADVI